MQIRTCEFFSTCVLVTILHALYRIDTIGSVRVRRADMFTPTHSDLHCAKHNALDEALICPELSIANAKTITYSDPRGPSGRREENSIAKYTCMNGFKKAGNKGTRVCKNGKFNGKEQLCVGVCYFEKNKECSSMCLH